MKYIAKQDEPDLFTQWKALANEDWQPAYEDLRDEEKRAVIEALKAEQGDICCYCERRLTDGDLHIEHFRPQSDSLVDPLDFGNMLCSCQDRLKKGAPRHCGNRKGGWFDAELLVSPLDPECEGRFAFLWDGSIKPAIAADAGASTTIKKLGLDISKLNEKRAKALEPFLDEGLSFEEVRTFVAGYLERDSLGRFGEFWTMVRYLSDDLVAE